MNAQYLVSIGLVWSNVLCPLLVAVVVWLSASGIGLALLRLASPNRALTGFEATFAPALGFAALGYASDLIFMTGRVDMRPVYGGLTLAGLLLLGWRVRNLRWTRESQAAPWADRVFWTAGWAVVAWCGWKLFVGNVTPVNDNDSIYHYAFYSRLLSAGATFDEILLLRNFPLTDLNRVVQHVYALAGTLGGDGALHLVNLLFIVGIALIAQGVSADVLRVCRWTSPLPVLAVLSLREIIYTGFAAKLDYGATLFELGALAVFLTWRDRRLWMLALGLGWTLCARTNSLRFAAVIPLLWMVDQWWSNRADGGWSALGARTLAVGAGTLLVAVPPYAMQQFIYGNPVFPMLNDVFGEYQHYYDWVILDTLRYKTVYGWFSAPVVYVTVALKNLVTIPGVVTPQNTPFGLSALMLMAPLAFRRNRSVLWLLGFVVFGYETWYVQTNTHRTLLSVAVVAVILGAAAISRLRARAALLHFALFAGVVALASWTARDFLGLNYLDHFNYLYVQGRLTQDGYHDLLVRRLYPGMIPTAEEVNAIGGIVGRDHLASINLAPFAHPRLIRTRRVQIPTETMATIAADEKADATDRRIARELLESPFVSRQGRSVFARLWPEDGRQHPLAGAGDLRWYLAASYDAWRFVSDALLEDPNRLAPMLRFEGVRYVLAERTSVYAGERVNGLSEVWRSEWLVLLRVEAP